MTSPRTVHVWCQTCTATTAHLLATATITCPHCRTARVVDEPVALVAEAISEPAPVQDMRDCGWCKERLPADHVCPAGAVGCTTRQPDETPCGACLGCIAAMTADLVRYGSPSDLTP
jgi:DNA-directed RNA polymerase subunit RPC12/RpoP